MASRKFRFSLEGLPPQVISRVDGVPVLRLRITTQAGQKDLTIRDGQIVKTEDGIAQLQLERYAPPKLPRITRKLKGALSAVSMTHKFEDYKDVRPFVEVADDSLHDLEL